MAFTDKLKSTIKATDSLAGQKIEEAKIEAKIADQKSQRRRHIDEAGDKMFQEYLKGAPVPDDVRELFEKAKACNAEVERLEAEKKDIIEKGKAERDSIN